MQGKGVSDGIAIGILTIYRRASVEGNGAFLGVASEMARLHQAVKDVQFELETMRTNLKAIDDTSEQLIEAYQVMLYDPVLIDSIERVIKAESICCEAAVSKVKESLGEMFAGMNDEYMQARAEDVVDVSNRLLGALSGEGAAAIDMKQKAILLADDLTPGETMHIDKEKVLAFVTRRGSALSHTAILARGLGIPAVVGVDYPDGCEGKMAIVDAYEGKLIIEPDELTLGSYRRKADEIAQRHKELEELKTLPVHTLSGKPIGLHANVGNLDEIDKALENGCQTVGLFRTEFMYLNTSDFPTEEAQYQTYKKAIEKLNGGTLTVRTFDLGGDKMVPYLDIKPENNPAMGMRAIRYSLGHKDVFRTQLRAIYRAAAHGDMQILLPMVISLEEVRQVKDIIREVKNSLEEEYIAYGNCRLGIMIETPAAAMISDILACEVDFFSIGTNDLTQYMLAVDRQNTELEFICDYHHEAIIRTLRMIIGAGHAGGCSICVCGELAADVSFTRELIAMGVDELSVAPAMLLSVKKAIRES